MSFFSKQTRIVCESCETIDKREDKINTLLKQSDRFGEILTIDECVFLIRQF